MSIKNVAIFGAAGALGKHILQALLNSSNFNIIVISREGSKSVFPASVKVVKADYNSIASLTTALQGQDAVISAVGNDGLLGQSLLVDAAIAAGVKRFLPSEFGSDSSNPKTAKLPVFGHKIAVRKHIEEKIRDGADIAYTYVINGAFLDWGLDVGFLFDWKIGKPVLYNGGDRQFSTTSLANVGRAVVGVLSHLDETKNRSVYIQDRTISQNQILEIAKKVAPKIEWEPVIVSTAEMKKNSDEKLAKGDFGMDVMFPYLFVSIFDEAYGGRFEKLDNDLLGVVGTTDEDVEAMLKKILV